MTKHIILSKERDVSFGNQSVIDSTSEYVSSRLLIQAEYILSLNYMKRKDKVSQVRKDVFICDTVYICTIISKLQITFFRTVINKEVVFHKKKSHLKHNGLFASVA